jgi:hypothetical protein
MKTSNNKIALAVGAIAIIGGGYALLSGGKKNEKIGADTFDDGQPQSPSQPATHTTTPTTTTAPVTLNGNLLLKSGSHGAEVKKLQTLLGVTSDGAFGPITENALFGLKGVKQVTLNQFAGLPNINHSPVAVGTRVMAKNRAGAKIYGATAKADGTYFSTEQVDETIEFGQEVGKIKGYNGTKTWYSIYYDAFLGQKVGFVLASDVEPI